MKENRKENPKKIIPRGFLPYQILQQQKAILIKYEVICDGRIDQ